MEFRLREILNERGISIRTFANQMGVVPNSLPISVSYAPSLSSLQRYANTLNIPAVELVHKPDVPTPITEVDMTDKFDLSEMALNNIKQIIEEKRMMLKTVAEKAGMSQQALSQTMKRNKMSITTLEKIAQGLDVEPWTLLEKKLVAKSASNDVASCSLSHAERVVQMEEGVIYVFGKTRISINGGMMDIKLIEKDS